jgi:predicted nucleotidyltransferase
MRGFLDRDFLRTGEDFFFCVVGGIHPRDRVIAYLKYVPSPEGKWGGTEASYARTMPNYTIPSLAANIQWLATQYPQYVFHSRALNIRMSAVPRRLIAAHYDPRTKLQQLVQAQERDPLQDTAVHLVTYLSDETAIPPDAFGVTGSILTDIHQPTFSDIDLVCYGLHNGWTIKGFLQKALTNADSCLTKHSREERSKVVTRWATDYPLTRDEAAAIYRRRWNYGFFQATPFSIHVIKTRGEINEKYGDQTFTPLTIIEGRATIRDVHDALALPCTYGVDFLDGPPEGVTVEAIVSYDGLYGGIFDVGDVVRVRGKLERVVDRRRGRVYHRVLVGSLEARGKDYLKPI